MAVYGDVKQDEGVVFPHSALRFMAKLSDFEHPLLENDLPCYLRTPAYNALEIHKQQAAKKSGDVLRPNHLP